MRKRRWLAEALALTAAGSSVASLWLLATNGDRPGLAGSLRWLVVAAAFWLIGWYLAKRLPENPIGYLLLVSGVAIPANLVTEQWAYRGLVLRPGDVAGPIVAAWFHGWLWAVPMALLGIYVPLLFPDGRLLSPRWRPVAWAGGAALTVIFASTAFHPRLLQDQTIGVEPDNPIGVSHSAAATWDLLFAAGFVALGALTVASVASVVLRYAHATTVQRDQIRVVVATMVIVAAVQFFPDPNDLASAGIVLVPVAVGVAVLRYRLYAIDRIISRTVSYALITAVLVAIYVLVAVVPATLFDLQSDLLAAGATLAAAAAFGPVRRRVQTQVDRRFNRSRYDALRTADAFRARLRHTVDLEDLSTDLIGTVGTTVQPAHATVWLRPTSP